MKTHFLRSKFQKRNYEKQKIFTGPTDTANFNQVLSKHLYEIVFYTLTFFGPNMSCKQKKRRKLLELLKRTVFCLKKTMKKPVFLRFFGLLCSGR
jgi:hypothetical protein